MPSNQGGLPGATNPADNTKRDNRLNRLSRLMSTDAFLNETGRTGNARHRRVQRRIGRVSDRLRGMGVEFDENGRPMGEGIEFEFEDFSGDFNPESASSLAGVGLGLDEDGNRRHGRASIERERAQELLDRRFQEENEAFYEENQAPVLDRMLEEANRLINEPTIGAFDAAALRSAHVAGVRQQEDTRQDRLASLFGTRGVGGGSPASAAIVNAVTEAADARVARDISELNLHFRKINREGIAAALAAAQSTVAATTSIRRAALDPDHDRSRDMNLEIAALQEGFVQLQANRDFQMQMTRQAIDAAQDTSTMENVAGYTSIFQGITKGIGNLKSSGVFGGG